MKNKTSIIRIIYFVVLLYFTGGSTFIHAQSTSCGTPQNLHINNLSTSSGLLDWNGVTEATGYIVKFRPVGSTIWHRQPSTNSTEIITALISNTYYEAKVRCDCGAVEGLYSSLLYFKTNSNSACAVPNVYYFTSNNITSNSCRVGWRNITGVSNYNVQYRVRYSNAAWITNSSITNSLELTGLNPLTLYEFRVQTLCNNGTGMYSLPGIFTTKNNDCSAPVNLMADNISLNSATLNWSPLICATAYNLNYRAVGSNWISVTTTSNSYDILNLDEGTNYEFSVQSVNATNAFSAFSQSFIFATSSSLCETPINIIANAITTNQVTISWTTIDSTASYNIRYRLAGALSWQTVSTQLNIVEISGLSPDNDYEFQVQSVCSPLSASSFTTITSFLTLPDLENNIPVPDHIVICIMENKAYSQIVNGIFTPHINALKDDPMSATFNQSYGLSHPSQPNYLQLFSGSNQGITNNNLPLQHFTTPNLAMELLNVGKTFVSYCEGLPNAGYDGATYIKYARKHNPIANWMGTDSNQVSSALNQPFADFPMDYAALPTVSLVVPDMNNNMHDGALGTALANGDEQFYWLRLSDLKEDDFTFPIEKKICQIVKEKLNF